MDEKKKALKQEYRQNPAAMGIYQIHNVANGKILVGSSPNLPGVLNRHRFQLLAGNHPNKSLQSDWNQFGSDSFAFETVDELSTTEGPDYDYRPDLIFLEETWLEKFQPYGERGYNTEKKGKEEKLREIAQNRLSKETNRG